MLKSSLHGRRTQSVTHLIFVGNGSKNINHVNICPDRCSEPCSTERTPRGAMPLCHVQTISPGAFLAISGRHTAHLKRYHPARGVLAMLCSGNNQFHQSTKNVAGAPSYYETFEKPAVNINERFGSTKLS